MIKESINLLGLQARDKISGLTGTITSVSFDLFGCVQATIYPPVEPGKASEAPGAYWVDVSRIELISEAKDRVMSVPDFDKVTMPADYQKGPAAKPARTQARRI